MPAAALALAFAASLCLQDKGIPELGCLESGRRGTVSWAITVVAASESIRAESVVRSDPFAAVLEGFKTGVQRERGAKEAGRG